MRLARWRWLSTIMIDIVINVVIPSECIAFSSQTFVEHCRRRFLNVIRVRVVGSQSTITYSRDLHHCDDPRDTWSLKDWSFQLTHAMYMLSKKSTDRNIPFCRTTHPLIPLIVLIPLSNPFCVLFFPPSTIVSISRCSVGRLTDDLLTSGWNL